MNKNELKAILDEHKKWMDDPITGRRADLSGEDLAGADLSGEDLSGAVLVGAILTGAEL